MPDTPKPPPTAALPRDDTGTQPLDTAPHGRSSPRPTIPTLPPGTTLGGYQIVRVLGVGGMGAVYLAADPRLGRHVAVKTMRPELAADPAARERFLREARATATVEHENVVAVFTVGEDGDTPYLVMPLLKGESLDDRLKRGPVPLTDACRIAREVADGLAAAHAKGLIHRDVKPSNVWLEPGGKVKLLDFGLARPMEAGEGLTALGAIVGTPAYMAPEQAAGDAVDARADLFSLGCVLYQLATGRRPFGGATVMAILSSLATHTPPPADRVNPGVPPELARLIDRLMAKTPAGRPGSAAEVGGHLLMIEAGLKAGAFHAIPIDPPPVAATDWSALTDDDRASGGRQPPVSAPRRDDATGGLRPPLAGRGWWPFAAAGLLLLGAVGLYLLLKPAVVTTGKLLIDAADDPAAEVIVSQRGAVVAGPTGQREIDLPAGEYDIELAGKRPGERLNSRRVRIDANGTVAVKVVSDRRPPTKSDEPGDPGIDPQLAAEAEGQLAALVLKAQDPKAEFGAVATEVVAFRAKYGGTPQALTAAGLLTKLGSPLDALDPGKIPADARAAWAAKGFDAKDVVGVIGEHRRRHWGTVVAVACSADGRRVVSGGDDNRVRFWDPDDGRERSTISGYAHPLALTAAGDRLVVGRYDGCRLWDVTGATPRLLSAPVAKVRVTALAFGRSDARLAAGTEAGGVHLFDLAAAEPKPLAQWEAHVGGVASVSFSQDGNTLATAGKTDGRAVVWDLTPGKPTPRCAVEKVEGPCVLTPDGKTLVALPGGVVGFYDVSGAAPKELAAAGAKVKANRLASSGDGRLLASAAQGGFADLWDVAGRAVRRSLPKNPEGGFWDMAFTADGKRLFSAGHDGTVRAWDTDTGTEPQPHGGPLGAYAVVPRGDGRTAITFSSTNGFAVWDLVTGRAERTTPWSAGGLTQPALSPDGRWLAAGRASNGVFVWATRTTDASFFLPGPPRAGVKGVSFSPDGGRLAGAVGDGTVWVWDLTTRQPAHAPLAHGGTMFATAYSPDGRRLASVGGNEVIVRDAASGAKVWSGPHDRVKGMRYSPDGSRLATWGYGGSIKMWTPTGGSLPDVWTPAGGVDQLVFGPDGRAFVACSHTGHVVLSAADTGKVLRDWQFPGRVFDIAFAADGRHLLTTNANGTVYVLRLPPAALFPPPDQKK